MSRSRFFMGLSAAALLIAAFAWAFRTPPVPVDLADIGRGALEVTVADEGVTRIREIFTISAPVPGRVLRTPLDSGDLVRRDETVVAMIEPQAPAFLDLRLRREAEAAVRSAEAALSLARAELTRAEAERRFWLAELKRNEALSRTNTIAARTLEQTRLELDIREAAVSQMQASVRVREEELERAKAVLIEPDEETTEGHGPCCLSVRSPISGRVLDVVVESEQVVASGAPLLTVGDPNDLEIVVELLSADAVRVELGADAVIDRWGGPGTLEAEVTRIEPAGFTKVSALGIEEQRVNVILDITSAIELWRGLGHDYRVFAHIYLLRLEDVVRVPMGAVFRQGEDWAVFVERKGRAELRLVELGERNSHWAEMLSGLDEGERVILHPSDRIADRVRVTDREKL